MEWLSKKIWNDKIFISANSTTKWCKNLPKFYNNSIAIISKNFGKRSKKGKVRKIKKSKIQTRVLILLGLESKLGLHA